MKAQCVNYVVRPTEISFVFLGWTMSSSPDAMDYVDLLKMSEDEPTENGRIRHGAGTSFVKTP